MIDIHSHILPGIDDGAADIGISLEMARIAVQQGTTHMACTPHIMPGVYENDKSIIRATMDKLRASLFEADIQLQLLIGADAHITPNLLENLKSGHTPSLADNKYFLFEPPHHVCPPNMPAFCKKLIDGGYIPILTHPERLTWVEKRYDVVCEIDEIGAPIQLTAASITGKFGKRAKYWSDRMLDEGRVDVIASDAHDPQHRPPGMIEARDLIVKRYSDTVANILTKENPGKILLGKELPKKKRNKPTETKQSKTSWKNWIGLN